MRDRKKSRGIFTDSTDGFAKSAESPESKDSASRDDRSAETIYGVVGEFESDETVEGGVAFFKDDEFTLEDLSQAESGLSTLEGLVDNELSEELSISTSDDALKMLSETEISRRIGGLLDEMDPKDRAFAKKTYGGAMIGGRPDESTYDESSEEKIRPIKLSMAAKAHKSDGDLLKNKSDNVEIKKSKSVENRELHSVSPPRTQHLFRKMSQRILGRDDSSSSSSSSSDEMYEPSTSPTRPSIRRKASDFFKLHHHREESLDAHLEEMQTQPDVLSMLEVAGLFEEGNEASSPTRPSIIRRASEFFKHEHNEKDDEVSPKSTRKKKDSKEAEDDVLSTSPKSSTIFGRRRGGSKGAVDYDAPDSGHKLPQLFSRKSRKSTEKAPVTDDRGALLTILQHDDMAVLEETAKGNKFSRTASEVLYYENIQQQNLRKLIYACGITQDMSDVLLYAGGFIAKPPFDLQPQRCSNYIDKLHTALRYGMTGVNVRLDESKIRYGRRNHTMHRYKFKSSEEDERVQAAHYMAAFNLMEGMSIEDILESMRDNKITVGISDIKGKKNIKAILDVMSQQFTECAGILYLLVHAVSFKRSVTTMEFMKICCAANIEEMMNFANTDFSNFRDLGRFADVFSKQIIHSEKVLLQRAMEEIGELYALGPC